MGIQRKPATTPVEELAAAVESDGAVIVENLVTGNTIERLRDDVVRHAENVEAGTGTQGMENGEEFAGRKTKRFSSLGHVSPAYFDLLDNELYARLADRILLPNCGSYWVNTGMTMLIGPGNPAQVLHRDSGNWAQYCEALWPECPEVTLSAIIGLDSVTETLGATRVIPGSHRGGSYRDRGRQEDAVPAELEAGDALVYSGHVLHGGGENKTPDTWRLAVHLSFVAGWLTPEESSPLDYDDELLRDKSKRVQRVLGHRSYDPTPHYGGGLWLRQVQKMESINGYER